jgi:hypothetical protein
MGASEAGEGELDAVAGGAVSPVKSDGEAERSRVEDEDEPSAQELAAQRRREEEERPLTEEELAQINAASNVQAVFRGHRARRAALFTPLWVPYPVPLNALQWGYEDPPAVAQLQRRFDYAEQLDLLNMVLAEGLGALPHHLAHNKGRPIAARRPRSEHLRDLVLFCLTLARAYYHEGAINPAAFLWEVLPRIHRPHPRCEPRL